MNTWLVGVGEFYGIVRNVEQGVPLGSYSGTETNEQVGAPFRPRLTLANVPGQEGAGESCLVVKGLNAGLSSRLLPTP